MSRYVRWLSAERGLDFEDYDSLWRWSIADIAGFWGSLADFLQVKFVDKPSKTLGRASMPGAVWFPGATLNYAEHALAGDAADIALLVHSQTRAPFDYTRGELRREVARARAGLVKLGVREGDRVAAYLPNIPEAIIAFLATASLGAIWISCPPEFGTRSVLDRLQQVDPKILIMVDGYMFGGKRMDKAADVAEIRAGLSRVEATVMVPYLDPNRPTGTDEIAWRDLLAEEADLEFVSLPFGHPVYILFSSGTTGKPKAIVHGHGSMVLEHQKWLSLHEDIRPGDRFFVPASTGWMTWNMGVSALLCGASLLVFDGDPTYPDLASIWKLVGETKVTFFGVAAASVTGYRKAGLSPKDEADLSALRTLFAAGAPLPPEGFEWVSEYVGQGVKVSHPSGGTDICSGFVGMNPLVPVFAGEISRPLLGCAVDAFDEAGHPAPTGQQGELVITAPLPSMPIAFWNDPGDALYKETYFERFPGVWRHGDWITFTERGSCFISGRSDATLNRGGVRLGTTEFYAVLEEFAEILDSLVIHIEDEDRGLGELLLFVALSPAAPLDDVLRRRISSTLRSELSPRHVPSQILAVPMIPRNISGKRMEVPIKRLLVGALTETDQAFGSIADPRALRAFVELAKARCAKS